MTLAQFPTHAGSSHVIRVQFSVLFTNAARRHCHDRRQSHCGAPVQDRQAWPGRGAALPGCDPSHRELPGQQKAYVPMMNPTE